MAQTHVSLTPIPERKLRPMVATTAVVVTVFPQVSLPSLSGVVGAPWWQRQPSHAVFSRNRT